MSNTSIYLIKKNIDGTNSYVSAQDLGLIVGNNGSLQISKTSKTYTNNTINSPLSVVPYASISGDDSVVIGGNAALYQWTGNGGVPTSVVYGDINSAGPQSIALGFTNQVSGCYAVAVGSCCGFSINGGVLVGGSYSRTKDFGVVVAGFSNNSGINSSIYGAGQSIITHNTKNSLILGGRQNLIGDIDRTSISNLANGNPNTSAMCSSNASSPDATFPTNSIIGAGERNQIFSGTNNVISNGFNNCTTNVGLNGKNVGNVILNGANHTIQRSNYNFLTGPTASIDNQCNIFRYGGSFEMFKIDGNSTASINMGPTSTASQNTFIVGDFNFDGANSAKNSVVLGQSHTYRSPALIFGSSSQTQVTGDNLNILYGRRNIISTSTVSGVTSFADSTEVTKTFAQTDSNTLRLTFNDGIYLKSLSGVLFNNKRYLNIRQTITKEQDPNPVLGLFI